MAHGWCNSSASDEGTPDNRSTQEERLLARKHPPRKEVHTMTNNPLVFTMGQRRKAQGRFKARRGRAIRRINRIRSPGYGPIPTAATRNLRARSKWKIRSAI